MCHSGVNKKEQTTQSHKGMNASKTHSNYLDSSGSTLLHETRCASVCGAAIPLPFSLPTLCLSLMLSGDEQRVVHPGRLLPGAPHLLCLQDRVPFLKADLESKSRCSKMTCWKWTTAKAKPTRSPTPAVCSGCNSVPPHTCGSVHGC